MPMFDATPKATTMKDVAKEVGCHPSTVSLALRGDVRIPEATQNKIALAAARLGYQTNPLVSAWVSARRAGRTVDRNLPFAYIDQREGRFGAHSEDIYIVAHEKAKEHGYSLNKFYIEDYAKNLSRLGQVLATRNVQGVVLSPNLEGTVLDGIDWKDFAIVAVGYGISSPKVHRVVEDNCSMLKQAFGSFVFNGSRRIGLALSRESNEMRQGHWLGVYLREQMERLCPAERLPVHFSARGYMGSSGKSWLMQYKPEVLLVDNLAAWDGCGIHCVDLMVLGKVKFPCAKESCGDVGQTAIDLLASLVSSNTRGVPSNRRTVVVESPREEIGFAISHGQESSALSA